VAPDLLDQTMISHGSTDVDLIYIYKVRSDMNHNMNLGRSPTPPCVEFGHIGNIPWIFPTQTAISHGSTNVDLIYTVVMGWHL
jgi:hypothetical protein